MKRHYLCAILCVLCCVACSDDNPIIPPTPEPPGPTPEPEAVYMKIFPVLEQIKQTRGIIEQFIQDDKLGLYITNGELDNAYDGKTEFLNMQAVFSKDAWTHKAVEMKDAQATVYSYYPYTADAGNGKAIPVESTSQTDYLYGTASTATLDASTANISMKHAMSLVSFKIKKNDYQYAGKITKIEIEGVKTKGTMDISTGNISQSGEQATLAQDCNYLLDDANIKKTSIISLPTVIGETSGVVFHVTVDGEVCDYVVPTGHNWLPGYEYIYTLNLRKMSEPPTPDDVELDIQYWEKYGKEDEIVVGSNSGSMLRLSANYGDYGRTVIRGESRYFSAFVYNYGDAWEGKIRMALYDGDQLVEQYQAYNVKIDKKGIGGWTIPCYVNCDPGTYSLKPLFQNKGSEEWFMPRYSGDVEDADWIYTVQASTDMPACRTLNLVGELPSTTRIHTVKLNTPFNMEFIITNRAGVDLHGEVKAVWERTFTGEFNEQWKDDGISWSDEIGRVRIDLSKSERNYNGLISCNISVARTYPNIYSPAVHLYYKADGTDTWVLMRCDSDNTLQKLKDVTEGLIWDENNEYAIGGMEYIVTKWPSVNYSLINL